MTAIPTSLNEIFRQEPNDPRQPVCLQTANDHPTMLSGAIAIQSSPVPFRPVRKGPGTAQMARVDFTIPQTPGYPPKVRTRVPLSATLTMLDGQGEPDAHKPVWSLTPHILMSGTDRHSMEIYTNDIGPVEREQLLQLFAEAYQDWFDQQFHTAHELQEIRREFRERMERVADCLLLGPHEGLRAHLEDQIRRKIEIEPFWWPTQEITVHAAQGRVSLTVRPEPQERPPGINRPIPPEIEMFVSRLKEIEG